MLARVVPTQQKPFRHSQNQAISAEFPIPSHILQHLGSHIQKARVYQRTGVFVYGAIQMEWTVRSFTDLSIIISTWLSRRKNLQWAVRMKTRRAHSLVYMASRPWLRIMDRNSFISWLIFGTWQKGWRNRILISVSLFQIKHTSTMPWELQRRPCWRMHILWKSQKIYHLHVVHQSRMLVNVSKTGTKGFFPSRISTCISVGFSLWQRTLQTIPLTSISLNRFFPFFPTLSVVYYRLFSAFS